jgi:anti-sigma factor (TIGR02949 family)
VNCDEVKEQISPAVDNRLTGDERRAFEHHIGQCPQCRNEFELERMTKRVVMSAIVRSRTPAELSAHIIAQLPPPSGDIASKSWFERWRAVRMKPVLIAGALGAVALLLFVSLPLNLRHTHTSPNDNNIIHQTLNNYDAILAGTITPEVASSNPAEVKTYFAQRVEYHVRVPKAIDKCQLIGGLVSDYYGKQIAHVVYKYDDEVVYLYQVDMSAVTGEGTLTIPDEAREQLRQTGWYVLSLHPKCNLVMWLVDNTLCTAVADMEKDELISYLTHPDE